jgi:hypothetical protein
MSSRYFNENDFSLPSLNQMPRFFVRTSAIFGKLHLIMENFWAINMSLFLLNLLCNTFAKIKCTRSKLSFLNIFIVSEQFEAVKMMTNNF